MLLLAAAAFVGSQSCRPCHAAIADAYAATPMARSSGPAPSLPPANFTAAGVSYRIAGNLLSFPGASVPIHLFVGSGAAGRSYLTQREGYLYELPVTWYTRKGAWDASPGYERETEVRLNRAVEPSCLACHSSRVRPVLGTQNRYGDPPFLEGGVSCERCHGPAGDHVRDPVHSPLVNPARLAPALRDSICSQCHLTGEARIERPGRRVASFVPGESLAAYATYFVWAQSRQDLKVTSHVEKLASSRCKQASGDALWCGACHDPHTNADRTQAACTGCHPAAHHAAETCVTCHMPKARVFDGGHGVFTDHAIPRVPQPPSEPAHTSLKAFLGEASNRDLGLAYAELGDPRARAYLLQAQPADAPVQLRLAVLEPNPARAAALYEAVLRAQPSETSALVNLGILYAAAGRVDQAVMLWKRALAANPALEPAALNLARVQPPAEAKATLMRYLDFNPASTAARARLAAVP